MSAAAHNKLHSLHDSHTFLCSTVFSSASNSVARTTPFGMTSYIVVLIIWSHAKQNWRHTWLRYSLSGTNFFDVCCLWVRTPLISSLIHMSKKFFWTKVLLHVQFCMAYNCLLIIRHSCLYSTRSKYMEGKPYSEDIVLTFPSDTDKKCPIQSPSINTTRLTCNQLIDLTRTRTWLMQLLSGSIQLYLSYSSNQAPRNDISLYSIYHDLSRLFTTIKLICLHPSLITANNAKTKQN